jgi:predicted unusual protein kinase regulating ubiquinone biosynthesis (AarF/ABC1/UbiB family)
VKSRHVPAPDRSPGGEFPPALVRAVLAAEAPQVEHLAEYPAAVGDLAQVHRGRWPDGREVAVKVQFPGAPERLREEHERLRLRSRAFRFLLPGFPVAQLLTELHRNAAAELDCPGEAAHQRAFAAAYRGDPDVFVPEVLAAGRRVVVMEWVAGTGVADLIATGTPQQRDRVADLLTTFQLSAPARAGLLHADPDSANFRILPDGRLAVLDFGAVAPYPEGLPPVLGQLLRATIDRDAERLDRLLRTMGAVTTPGRVAPRRLLALAESMVLPVLGPGFRFDRHWLRRQIGGLTLGGGLTLARGLRLPPGFLPLLRMVVGTVDLFCRLEARADYAGALSTWLPGFAEA